ncbi:MAG: YraN family protein [Microbacterium sp.]|uniref:YraN family protein n=1 Tax=Microbacterium sp. TaxID=51671 RepID=UPI0039E6F9BC
MADKDELGRRGEEFASAHLRRHGWTILARNWRGTHGELDIVAREGAEIVVVEVKTRASELFGHPLEAIDARKLSRLWRLGAQWCREHPDESCGARLRVDAVALIGRGAFTLEHLRDLR